MSSEPSTVYLQSYLGPLDPYLARDDVTDIYVNRPGEVWLETLGGETERIEAPALTTERLSRLARQIAAVTSQGINRAYPLMAATLPTGERIQIVTPPATRGHIALAVRKHVTKGLSLDNYDAAGAFAAINRTSTLGDAKALTSDVLENPKSFLRQAVREKKNILISGGTSSGKTTFLNALLDEVPREERLILIEDTPEVRLNHDNSVGLVASRGSLGEAEITTDDLLTASLRMRPDRIILGEIRGREAMTFLRAINTGHPGSLSTIHADSAERAIDQLALLIIQTNTQMRWDDIVTYVRRSLDVVVQLERKDGQRSVSQIISYVRTA